MHSGRKKHTKIENHLLKSLLRSLILNRNIKTLFTRAKALKSFTEPLVTTIAKKDCLHSRRRLFSVLNNDKKIANQFIKIAKNYSDRPGGYLKIFKIGRRKSDNGLESVIGFS